MKSESLAIIVGGNIRRLRRANAWSQEDLGAKSGLHRTYIGSIERAETNLTLSTLQKIAVALYCTPQELLEKYRGTK